MTAQVSYCGNNVDGLETKTVLIPGIQLNAA